MTEVTSRRTFFKQSGSAALGASAAAAPALQGSRAPDAPPNVVFIFCDQMRGDCISGLGHPNARTPHLDRMAREGVLFDNCFVNSPVCVPSRKSVFSGRYPHEHGSLTNQGRPFLSWPDTLCEHFQQRGYRTGWVGKNHTYKKSALDKLDTASIRAREPFRAYNGFVPPNWHTDVYWPEEDCYPQVNSDQAIDFIRKSKDEPFFLHVSYFDPHPPYMAPADFTSRYISANMRLPVYVAPGALSERLEEFATTMGQDHMTRADMTETMRYYYAQIEWGVGRQVGRILSALEQQGLAENTIVLFTSDHGDFMGTHRMVRKGMFLYDSLLHVPMIWWAPGRLAKGEPDQRYCPRYRHFSNAGGRQRRQAQPGFARPLAHAISAWREGRRPARRLHLSRLRRSGTGTEKPDTDASRQRRRAAPFASDESEHEREIPHEDDPQSGMEIHFE